MDRKLLEQLIVGPLFAGLFLGLPAHGLSPSLAATGDEEGDEEEEEDRYFAVVGGDVYTGTGAVMRGVTVLSKNGKVEEIGHNVFLPEGTEILDGEGLRVYPGFVALNATTGVTGGLFSAEIKEPEDRDILAHLNETLERVIHGHVDDPGDGVLDENADWEDVVPTPTQGSTGSSKNKFEDSFDPFSPYMTLALATGITTAEQSGAAVKLKRGEIGDVVMNDRNLVSFSWSTANPSGIRSLRDKFSRTREYTAEYQAWQARGDKDEKEPAKRGVDTGALRVLRNEAMARFRANDREDLVGIARFAQEYGFRPVIDGCREGWTVADELGRAGAYAILTARDRRPKNEALVREGGTNIQNAAILHSHGVQVAVKASVGSFESMGITGRDLLHLPVEAAFAVRGGLSNEAALAAITTVPARILGVSERVGTIEVGKDCDLILTDGDVLHYQTFVQYAVVAGKPVYDKEEELYFAHIRPRPKKAEPEAAQEEPAEEEGADEDHSDEGDEGDEGDEDDEDDD